MEYLGGGSALDLVSTSKSRKMTSFSCSPLHQGHSVLHVKPRVPVNSFSSSSWNPALWMKFKLPQFCERSWKDLSICTLKRKFTEISKVRLHRLCLLSRQRVSLCFLIALCWVQLHPAAVDRIPAVLGWNCIGANWKGSGVARALSDTRQLQFQ